MNEIKQPQPLGNLVIHGDRAYGNRPATFGVLFVGFAIGTALWIYTGEPVSLPGAAGIAGAYNIIWATLIGWELEPTSEN